MPPAGKAEGTGIRLTAMPDRCGGRGGRLDQAGGAISVSRPRRPAMQKIVADSTADAPVTTGMRLRCPSGEIPLAM